MKDSEKENKTPGGDTNGFGSKSAATFSSNSLSAKTEKSSGAAAFSSSSKVSETVASFSSSYKVIFLEVQMYRYDDRQVQGSIMYSAHSCFYIKMYKANISLHLILFQL